MNQLITLYLLNSPFLILVLLRYYYPEQIITDIIFYLSISYLSFIAGFFFHSSFTSSKTKEKLICLLNMFLGVLAASLYYYHYDDLGVLALMLAMVISLYTLLKPNLSESIQMPYKISLLVLECVIIVSLISLIQIR
jgi:hypothetical protein